MKYLHNSPLGKLPTWGTGTRRFVPMWCMKWSVCSSLNPYYQLISSPKFQGTICWNHEGLHYQALWDGKVLSSPSLQMGCWGAEQLRMCLHKKIKVYSQHKERHAHAGYISLTQVVATRSTWQQNVYHGQHLWPTHSLDHPLDPESFLLFQWGSVKAFPVWESFLISFQG